MVSCPHCGSEREVIKEEYDVAARERGYITIAGNMVKLTKKGLIECQKPKHEWD